MASSSSSSSSSTSSAVGPPAALLIGTGEYTTGYTSSGGSESDKKCGVVALVHFDLRRRGKVGERIALCGTCGTKLPAVREHLERRIGRVYAGLSTECDTFPADDVERDVEAYVAALDSFSAGDVVSIFTPDDTHFSIALEAVRRGLHVMVTKPIVKTVAEHLELVRVAREKNVLVAVEVHKRYDPLYADARNRIQRLGDLGYFVSYMSQPKAQLRTFSAWAGRSSDISYYLNSHHVDFLCWAVQDFAKPLRVTASASTGVAAREIGVDAEDSITLTVQWRNIESGTMGTSVHTASWAASKSDVHSQQRFFYQGHEGEINIDQAHRGFTLATDAEGLASVNPLFMVYTPDSDGNFVGQSGYGYQSFERFIDAVQQIRSGAKKASDFDRSLPTALTTLRSTAILEAGRRSLDADGVPMYIVYDDDGYAPIDFSLTRP